MFGKLGDMMGRLQDLKKQAEAVKEKLDHTTIDVQSAEGDIQIAISGSRRIRSLRIAPALKGGDHAVLETRLAAALNRALEAADRMNEDEMKKAAGGLLPGF